MVRPLFECDYLFKKIFFALVKIKVQNFHQEIHVFVGT